MTRPIWGKHYRVIKGIGRLPEGVYAEGRRGRGGEESREEDGTLPVRSDTEEDMKW